MSAKFHDSEGTEVHPHLKREYWCFISYRHADNKEPGRQWATWLHQALETYEVPADLVGTKNERGDFIPERIFPVFRDEEELPADAELSKPIEAALRRSRFLVVLCSPQAVQSRFVADEILRFKQLGKQDRILAAIIEGEPNASDDPAKGGVEQECFPQPLRFDVNEQGQLTSERTEPIAADFRFSDGASGWTSPAACREVFKAGGLSDEQIAKSVTGYTRKQNLMLLKIVAGVLGVPLGVLTQRDKAYQLEKQKQRTRVLRRWLAVVSIASLAAVLGGVLAWRYGIKAERYGIEAEISRENLRKSYSRSDEQMARQFTDNGQYNDAVAFLTRSLRTDPANDLSSTNLLSLLANAHLIRPEIAPLALPEGAQEATRVAVSRKAGVVLAVSSSAPKAMPALVRTSPPQREVVSIWNMKTGERTDYPMTPGVEVTCLDVTPDGLQAVIARNDGGVELWSLKDGKRRNLLPSLPGFVTCVAFSGNGEKLLVGSEIGADGMGGIHAWELYQPQEPARVMKQKGAVSEIATDDEGIFASSIYGGDPINLTGDDSAATTWDLRSGQPVGKPVEVDKGLLHVAIEPTHELIALGMNDGTLYVGSFRNGGEVLPPTTHSSAITSLAFSADGKSIIVGDSGGYVHIWNVGDGRLRHPTRRHDGEIFKAMAAMDTNLVSSISEHGEVSVFDIKTGALQSARLQQAVMDAKITPDGSMLVLAPGGMPFVQVWNIHERMSGRKFVDVLNKDLITRIKGPEGSPPQLQNPNVSGANRMKSMYAAADLHGAVFIYDATTLKPIGEPFHHPPAVGAVTLTQDEKLLITSGRDREVRVWDIATRKNIVSMRHASFASVLALSPDDERLVTVTDEGEMHVWNVRTGDCLTPAICDTPRESSDQEGIVVARVAEDGKSILFRVSEHGFFSAPMPPQGTLLPEWFLKFAEGLARRRLAPEGRIEMLQPGDFETAMAAIPQTPAPGEEIAFRWAKWLLAPAATRSLSPLEDQPFDAYLSSLKEEGSPAAARELLRYRPKDRDAAKKAAKLVRSFPK